MVCVSVCVGHTNEPEPTEMLYGGQTRMGSRNHYQMGLGMHTGAAW